MIRRLHRLGITTIIGEPYRHWWMVARANKEKGGLINKLTAVLQIEGLKSSKGTTGCSRITAPRWSATTVASHKPFKNKTFPTLTCWSSLVVSSKMPQRYSASRTGRGPRRWEPSGCRNWANLAELHVSHGVQEVSRKCAVVGRHRDS